MAKKLKKYKTVNGEKIYLYDRMTGKERITLIKKVVREHQYVKIIEDGHRQIVDGFTASAVSQVYDALSPNNRKKYSEMSYNIQSRFALKQTK